MTHEPATPADELEPEFVNPVRGIFRGSAAYVVA